MCRSNCTGQILPVHSLGVLDNGFIICMDCNGWFEGKAVELALRQRFGQLWEFKFRELKEFRRDVKRKVRAIRRNGNNPAETIYFIDPPVNPELHEDHMNNAGEHIKRPEVSVTDPLLVELIERLRKDGRMPKRSYLTKYGSHG